MDGDVDLSVLQRRRFYRLGEFCYDKSTLVLSLGLLITMGFASLIAIGPNWIDSYGNEPVESIETIERLSETVWAGDQGEDTSGFVIIIHHPTLNWDDSAYGNAVNNSLSVIDEYEEINLVTPWDVNAFNRSKYVSEDGHYIRIEVTITENLKQSKILFGELDEKISIDEGFSLWKTDGVAIAWTFDDRLADDLLKAEIISAPLSIIILAVVFGTVIAALLPVGIGLFTVLSSMGVVIWLSNNIDMNQYSVNIITLIGIGVSIDYSLFIVNRFREELANGRDIRTATAITTATAGKAIFFSGITVAIGLMGFLFFSASGMPSLGIGGTLAVTLAMLYSIILLPALMAKLGHGVNRWKVPYSMGMKPSDEGMWSKIAKMVMLRPWSVLIPLLVILLAAGLPFLNAEFGQSSWQALPPEDEARQGIETQEEIWPEMVSNNLLILIDGSDPLSEENLRLTHAYALEIQNKSEVLSVTGIAFPDANMTADDVVYFWNESSNLPDVMKSQREFLRSQFLHENVTYLLIGLDGPQNSVISRNQVVDIRNERDEFAAQVNAVVKVGGFAAYNQDILDSIENSLPAALIFIISATMILVFIQVRSIIIPIKAVAMNILSVTASFGMLVWVFQEGNGSELLNFTPQPIDPTNPVIMFCIVFGLSMDYEVLMLSRIHEEWENTGDNTLAVANGLQKTGMLITGAAAIMVVVFGAFGMASVVIIKQIGLGLALAIFIDATIVRALIVPSTMRLMGAANWWAPKWLKSSSDNHKDIEES